MSDTGTERIDVDAIMAEIRENIKTRGYKPAQLSFKDITASSEMTEEKVKQMAEAYDAVAHAGQIRYMEEYCDIDNITPIKGSGIKTFLKKVIRKLISPAILPILDQINAYHSATLEAELQSFYHAYAAEQENRELRKKVEALEEQIRDMAGDDTGMSSAGDEFIVDSDEEDLKCG